MKQVRVPTAAYFNYVNPNPNQTQGTLLIVFTWLDDGPLLPAYTLASFG